MGSLGMHHLHHQLRHRHHLHQSCHLDHLRRCRPTQMRQLGMRLYRH